VVSILDLAERALDGRDPVRRMMIGCSGVTSAQIVVIRESLPSGAHAEADEMLYLVAGEASITLGEKAQPITPGWFSVVPRGMARAVARKGRNPAVFLSVLSGRPCGAGSDSQSLR
jgi:mannose-6-phosphate isomerase-like protein (cupin superfamily)